MTSFSGTPSFAAAALPRSTVTPPAPPVALSRVAQKGEAAGPTPIATRSSPLGATSFVDATGALAQPARSRIATRQLARPSLGETGKPMGRGFWHELVLDRRSRDPPRRHCLAARQAGPLRRRLRGGPPRRARRARRTERRGQVDPLPAHHAGRGAGRGPGLGR